MELGIWDTYTHKRANSQSDITKRMSNINYRQDSVIYAQKQHINEEKIAAHACKRKCIYVCMWARF